jgi:nitrate reductase (NAD(P)H)
VRLTGRHPFNVEPIPSRLFESYITPPSLHYVRNHGAVPQIKWEEHRLAINGEGACMASSELGSVYGWL